MEPTDKKGLATLENGLIERFRRGEVEAFAGLVELYKDRVHQFILCILGPDREAEDIAQETFMQIYRSLPSFRGGSAFSTWVYALTRNICRHKLRDRGRKADLFSGTGDNTAYDLPEQAPSIELRLEDQETARLVRAAVDSLSPLHRAVIFLSCWEYLSYEEISRALDVPVGTVRSRIHNAMAALAQKLKPALAAGTEVRRP